MHETTKFTLHMCHELQPFVWEKPHSLGVLQTTSFQVFSRQPNNKATILTIMVDLRVTGVLVALRVTCVVLQSWIANLKLVKWKVRSQSSCFIIIFDGSKLCSSKTISNFTCLDIFLIPNVHIDLIDESGDWKLQWVSSQEKSSKKQNHA
jgi:hypothetical protein